MEGEVLLIYTGRSAPTVLARPRINPSVVRQSQKILDQYRASLTLEKIDFRGRGEHEMLRHSLSLEMERDREFAMVQFAICCNVKFYHLRVSEMEGGRSTQSRDLENARNSKRKNLFLSSHPIPAIFHLHLMGYSTLAEWVRNMTGRIGASSASLCGTLFHP